MALCVFEHEICVDRVPAKRFLETFSSITAAVFFKEGAAISTVQSTEGNRDWLEIQLTVRQFSVKKLFEELCEIMILG
jgi:hypothetical protein